MSQNSLGQMFDGAISRLVHDLVTPASGDEMKTAIEQLRVTRDHTTALIADLSQKQADFSPGRNSWSVGQVLHHLLLTDDLYRVQIRKLIDMAREGKETNLEVSLRELNPSFAFIPREVIPLFALPLKMMNFFVPHAVRETMIRFPLMPTTSPSVSDPRSGQPIEHLRAALPSSLSRLEELLQGNLPSRLNRVTFSHPILGTNNIPQIFRLLSAHEERHQSQIRDILANPRFP
jgi:hypothetical protein